jgi:DNA (cytosine-5)-methyltransferase 1
VRVGSLFTGIAGLDRGLEEAGMEVAWQCEIDKHARMILRRHYPDIPCYEDVTALSGRDVAPVDLIAAGSPCTNLSLSGKREGLDGPESRLFYEFVRILREHQPQWFIWENVPGALSSHAGRDMGKALGELADSGYGWAYRVLDASQLGVPQRRRRIITVGCLGGSGERAAKVLFEPASGDRNTQASGRPRSRPAAVAARGIGEGCSLIEVDPVSTARCGNTQDDQQLGQLIPVAFHLTQDPITSTERFPAMGAGNATGCATMGVGVPMAFSENQRAEVIEHEIAHQLSAPGGKPGQGYAAVRQGLKVRRLMPSETERLQGFPLGADGRYWTEFGIDESGNLEIIADSHRYRCCGNAVAVPMARWVGRRLMAAAAQSELRVA